MKLYHFPFGHAHRARLFLSLLEFRFELVEVDLGSGAHKTAEFSRSVVRPVPVLDDDGTIIATQRDPGLSRHQARPHRLVATDAKGPPPCSAGCRSPPANSPMVPRRRDSSPCSAPSTIRTM